MDFFNLFFRDREKSLIVAMKNFLGFRSSVFLYVSCETIKSSDDLLKLTQNEKQNEPSSNPLLLKSDIPLPDFIKSYNEGNYIKTQVFVNVFFFTLL